MSKLFAEANFFIFVGTPNKIQSAIFISFALRHACNIVKLSPPATATFFILFNFFTFSMISSKDNEFVDVVKIIIDNKQKNEKFIFILSKILIYAIII